jgi:hypothetical protein
MSQEKIPQRINWHMFVVEGGLMPGEIIEEGGILQTCVPCVEGKEGGENVDCH